MNTYTVQVLSDAGLTELPSVDADSYDVTEDRVHFYRKGHGSHGMPGKSELIASILCPPPIVVVVTLKGTE